MLHTLFLHVCETSPVKNDNFHPIYLLHLPWWIRTVSDFVLFSKLIHPALGLICSFCSSGRDFAASFLQIPPRGGHPCLKLTFPTVKVRSGLSPYSYRPCRAHIKKPQSCRRAAAANIRIIFRLTSRGAESSGHFPGTRIDAHYGDFIAV